MAPSALLLRLNRRFPPLGGVVFRLWRRLSLAQRREPHWLLVSLAQERGARLPFYTRLANGMPMQVFWGDYAGMKIHRQGYYERETVTLVQRLLQPGMVFVDAGAHCGQYTLIAGSAVGRDGRVYSFEPDPETFSVLAANVRENKATNVVLNKLALTERDGQATLYMGDARNIGANSLVPAIGYSGRQIEINCTRLDSYLSVVEARPVDLMKIDVEGAEISLLRGAEGLLWGEKRPMLIVEFNDFVQAEQGQSCRELADLLISLGYSLYRIGPELGLGKYATEDTSVYFNVLAAPAHATARLADLGIDQMPIPASERTPYLAGAAIVSC
jgi:FkbM family methyltransferase